MIIIFLITQFLQTLYGIFMATKKDFEGSSGAPPSLLPRRAQAPRQPGPPDLSAGTHPAGQHRKLSAPSRACPSSLTPRHSWPRLRGQHHI